MKAETPILHRYRLAAFLLALLAAFAGSQTVLANQFTVVNNCGYTVYPGIYPQVYANGGWQLNPGASVTFSVASNFNGRLWGRIGCDGSNPALCATGQCGGTGLQCAGTTGQKGTSLAEFTLGMNGIDDYDVSYVDGFDNPIGIQTSNGSCINPNTCTSAPLQNCPADLRRGDYCLSPCTAYGTDQYCCAGAYNTAQTCNVSAWAPNEQMFNTNIHNSCPHDYAYAYDDPIGNHQCSVGTNFTITFCPSGSGGGGSVPNLNGMHTLTPQNSTGTRLDDYSSGTASGNQIDIWAANGTGAQAWNFSSSGVSPAGSYNLAVSYGPDCVTATGTANGSVVNLQPCNGSPGQAWNIINATGGFELHPASNPSQCLDVRNRATGSGTLVQVWQCSGTLNQSNQVWSIN